MSKNLTLKGAAFGALVALSISAVAPASAAGLADTSLVTLAPSAGTEYTVITGASEEFSLKANFATAVQGTGKYIKFHVEDASDTIVVDNAGSSTYSVTADATSGDYTVTSDVVALDLAGAHKFKVGDTVLVDLQATGGTDYAAGSGTKVVTAVSGNVISYAATTGTTDVAAGDVTAGGIDGSTVKLVASARVSNKFVFQTRQDANTSDSVLVLETASSDTTSTATRVAKVTAWVDNNNNDVIDDSEYVSPTRTVTWIKPSELAITTVIDPVVVGDTSVTGYATTSPVLNGNQVTLADIDGVFGRQGTADTEEDGTAEWSDTTKKFTFSQTLTPGASTWTSLKEVGIASVSVASAVLTVNTTAAHGMTTNDDVLISGVTGTGADVDGIYASPTVVDADTFTVPVTSLTAAALGASPFVGASRGIAGTYTLLVDFAAAEGTKASTATAAKKVTTVTTAVKTAAGVASDGDVKTGTKSITLTATLTDSASAVVAGRQVKVGVSGTITGTHYLNGTKVTATSSYVWVTSDASGVATVTVTSDTAATSDNLDVTFTSEGVSGTAVNLDWEAASYVIAETTAGNETTNNFSVNKGGTYTLNVAVVDQWGAALTGDYRVFATGTQNSSFATAYALSSGRASIAVTDNQVVGGNGTVAVAVKVQKLVSGAWSDTHGLTGASARSFVVTVVDQTDVVLLDADASTTYGNDTADLSDAVASKAVTAVANSLLDNGTVFTDGGSGAGVLVSGRVANAATSVGRSGATATISGPSSVLFTYGNKSAFGSLTFVADTSGEFAVAAFSTVAQKDAVVTVTSGSVSKTAKITFTALAAANTGIIFAPVAKSAAGRTIDLTVKFTDKWGNLTSTGTAGTATFTSTGPGWLTAATAITSVDGIANVKLITSPEDGGIATITATTNVNDDDGVAIKVSKSILVGITGTVAAAKKAATATVKNASGATVTVVSGTKSVTKIATSDSFKVSLTKLTAGKKTVKVYVNDVLITSKSVTVKK